MKDLDFIKNKFEVSGVTAPEEINETNLKNKIENINPKKHNRKALKISVLAAAAAVVTVSAVALGAFFLNNPFLVPKSALVKKVDGIKSFKNRNEVVSAVKKIDEMYEALEERNSDFGDFSAGVLKNDTSSGLSAGNAAPSPKSDYNASYLQYNDVDEDDKIKTDGRYIFRVNNSIDEEDNDYIKEYIEVYSAKGKNSKLLTKIKPVKNDFTEYYSSIYIYEKKLVVISDIMTQDDNDEDVFFTQVSTYDITDIRNIKKIESYYQSGMYISSRLIGGKLYVITNHNPKSQTDLPAAGIGEATYGEATKDESGKKILSAKNIFSIEKPANKNFVVISEADVNDLKTENAIAIMGCASEIYCNKNNLYLLSENEFIGYRTFGNYYSHNKIKIKTRIIKVNLSDYISFSASALINGRIRDRYSLDEKDGFLRVAVSNYKDTFEFKDNTLYILDENLKQKGKVSNFAKGEEIKAVKYEGDFAYVITYEETDPLFVIDLKKPSSPKILGKVKISGFSTMLVPVDKNTLLGIGYHTEKSIEDGLKIAVFDISDKLNPKVTDTKSYKYFYSSVQEQPKALLVNRSKKTYSVPFRLGQDNYFTDGIEDMKEFGGVINLKVKNGKLISNEPFYSKKLSNVERCIYIGDIIYMFPENEQAVDCVKYKQ